MIDVFPVYDVATIQGVMMHPDILPSVIDSTWDGTVYQPDVQNEIWLGIVHDGDLIGVYNLHWFTGTTLQGHAHMLKAYRKLHSKESCMAVMRWVLRNVERCKKVACFVPFIYPNVKQFLAGCGFSEEGTLRNAFALNHTLHDMWIMGISSEQMQEVSGG